ncbi:hypothetical protein [Corticicoccus populi]|uniref:DUF3310 domain-containing protein n=1 Tax=Corticicoccus populi TaxID=1812821 RepID=A0ABW5WUU4_9STAP
MYFEENYFKDAVRTFCRVNNIHHQKVRYSESDMTDEDFEDIISIDISNSFDAGIDPDCFKAMDFILGMLGSTGTKYNLVSFYKSKGAVSKVSIYILKNDYQKLLNEMNKTEGKDEE